MSEFNILALILSMQRAWECASPPQLYAPLQSSRVQRVRIARITSLTPSVGRSTRCGDGTGAGARARSRKRPDGTAHHIPLTSSDTAIGRCVGFARGCVRVAERNKTEPKGAGGQPESATISRNTAVLTPALFCSFSKTLFLFMPAQIRHIYMHTIDKRPIQPRPSSWDPSVPPQSPAHSCLPPAHAHHAHHAPQTPGAQPVSDLSLITDYRQSGGLVDCLVEGTEGVTEGMEGGKANPSVRQTPAPTTGPQPVTSTLPLLSSHLLTTLGAVSATKAWPSIWKDDVGDARYSLRSEGAHWRVRAWTGYLDGLIYLMEDAHASWTWTEAKERDRKGRLMIELTVERASERARKPAIRTHSTCQQTSAAEEATVCCAREELPDGRSPIKAKTAQEKLIVIDNVVYTVQNYMDEHPAGANLLKVLHRPRRHLPVQRRSVLPRQRCDPSPLEDDLVVNDNEKWVGLVSGKV
ncbi:hypothetical protein M427DRAFT_34101 [Gonapodya prolifera JEL478]|uniref:Cytochrome b5 heme-binding domain-containing protein n=1 Tax=Gonapodya prolifera (strain JEL478) TaxID=1344416 RepID=A0A139A8V0_GONPJ|nr:hypothetical protein M427DRAFT_34101 [Gonapodya prolifera JEL478]|eukprot:KXS13232.1 hypothetical protein M427DRAFT_34101 [Gonapodya prolifera JEL478]